MLLPRAYRSLRFRPLWPRHFQSDGIITGAAMCIPPCGGGITGVPGCQRRNEMQRGDEPQRGRVEADCKLNEGGREAEGRWAS